MTLWFRSGSLLGVAALLIGVGCGIATGENDAASLPLQGPIPFEVFDLDGSGTISVQEFDEVRARRAEARAEAGIPSPRGSQLFSGLDGDGDGEITPEELQAAYSGAGRGRGLGMRGGRGLAMGGGPPVFSDFDRNGDGTVDEQEFIEARTQRIAERVREGRMMRGLLTAPSFGDLDTDGDGSLTPEEFEAGFRSHRERMNREPLPGVEP